MISSQLLNRQDGEDEYHDPNRGHGRGDRPAQGRAGSPTGCSCHASSYAHEDRMLLGYQCARSRMTLAVAADHILRTEDPHEIVATQ